MIHVHLNIGSNLGDRQDNLRRAVAALRQLAVDVSTVTESDIVVSPPWGYVSDNEYLNIGVSFDTDLTPEALLDATQKIEKNISDTAHRDSAGNYIDRIIDIDLIAAANIETAGITTSPLSSPSTTETSAPANKMTLITRNSAFLILPHPRALLRDFVLIPLRQIDPELLHLLDKKQ